MEFSRQEYWSGLSFPSPGDLPNPGIEPEPVQGILQMGPFLKKARVTVVTGSLDLLTRGLTCTLPSCQILWTRLKRSLASARKQAERNTHVFVCVFERGGK